MSSLLEFFSYNRSVLSGAMDIIAVRQPDDSYKISPFRIRFGSFRVFKTKEKIVNIIINGEKVDLTMRLSENGEAYFMHEIKRVVEDLAYLSDGYSPVELGSSAPTSPNAKFNPHDIKKLDDIENLKLEGTEKEIIENNQEINKNDQDQSVLVDFELKSQEKEEEDLGVEKSLQDYEEIESVLLDRSELQKKVPRKMSYDVFSRDESFYKFRPVRENSFSLENNSLINKSSMKIDLSNSWSQISKGKEKLEDIFLKNKINKDDFFKDPWKILNNNNLAIRYEDHVYTWKVIAPIIAAKLAFTEELPPSVMSSLTQQQEGFFLWKKVNLDAFKIDIKKKLAENQISNDILKETQLLSTPVKNNSKSEVKVETKISAEKNTSGAGSTETSPPQRHLEQKKHSIQYKKTYTLSSDQIKMLNLKRGKNEISFVVSSRIQGTHILSSDLYLWDCEDKILISDLDGTITRSDVLGNFLPFIGKDWSHKGVVKLFNEIDENGYKILYLTARSISQCDQTKNYIRNKLTQNKMKLPMGPILTSPDGLIKSFKREVIDRTPQSFKIDCLTQIVNLFPADAKPFFAGFGNRHTDAISYEAVGVSKNKIFIINEKGDISQYNYYFRTSYVKINEIVYEMFPPLTSHNTYFSSANYFRPTFGNLNIKKAFE